MKCKCLCALGVFALSVAVFAADAPQGLEHTKLIGVSRITELPPLPPNARPNTEVQPLHVPVPVFRVLSNEEMAR
ncbi:MAG: hypothetical protein PVI86_17640, partial [Phycisphaerae bacterium]